MIIFKYISQEYFLFKAAHCIEQKHTGKKLQPRDILVFFGGWLYGSKKYERSPDRIFVHHNWNPISSDGDLALLEFKKGRIRLGFYVEPICLWNPETEIKGSGMVAWWTEDSAKIYGIIPAIAASIKSKGDCLLSNVQANLMSHQTFCGTAGVDRGGGFFIEVSFGNFLMAGVESSSLSSVNGNLTENAVYTNVAQFIGWIENVAERRPKTQRKYQSFGYFLNS